MKNIHVLPTDKPSRLFFNKIEKKFIIDNDFEDTIKESWFQDYNIYITSDEEIKVGDWIYNISQKTVFKADESFLKLIGGTLLTNQKIILTTDQDLIKDGVQEVEEDFLNWFVKNPSCEFVNIITHYPTIDDEGDGSLSQQYYTLTISKEEPKQDLEKYPLTPDECYKQETLEEAKKQQFKYDNLQDAKEISSRIKVVETLEEAAERLQKDKYGIFISKDANVKGQFVINTAKAAFLSGMNEGAKWQQEQYELTVEDIRRDEAFEFGLKGIEMFSDGYDAGYEEAEKKLYSEEEVYNILEQAMKDSPIEGLTHHYDGDFRNLKEWFEQFKKK